MSVAVGVPVETSSTRGRVLVVDDEVLILRAFTRALERADLAVTCLSDSTQVPQALGRGAFDLVISDIAMPQMNGIDVLQAVRFADPEVPVILITGSASLDTAIKAVELGAWRYLTKPIAPDALCAVAEQAVNLRRASRERQQSGRLTRALEKLWMAYQPIVDPRSHRVTAYEALVRSDDTEVRTPGALFDMAEATGRLGDVGRKIRATVARDATRLPGDARIFVNLHPLDLLDADLYDPAAPLSRLAERVTLEVTERASLVGVFNLRARIADLRKLGFRIAIDDLGAGYAGLSALAEIEPEVVKLDMSLSRDIDSEPTRRRLVASIVTVCRDLGVTVVAEGIETRAERNVLVELGCDLLQGYWFGRPDRAVRDVAVHAFV
jgi:EAL domain-containing protein (putative c-di-GMP-specific phosphodiesterase class I)